MPPPGPDASLGFAVRRAHRAFDRALQRRLAAHGLTTGHWYYLRALWEQDGLTQRQLAQRTGVTENTTAVTVAAMVREGLVTRTRAPDDRRKWCIALTPRALALREVLLPLAHEVNAVAAADLSPQDHARALTLLARITARLGEDGAEE